MKNLFARLTTLTTMGAVIGVALIAVEPAQALNLKSYTVKWSGASLNNEVEIVGEFFIDLDLVNNDLGRTGGIPDEIGPGTPFHSIEMMVSGATAPNANGIFTTFDFEEVVLDLTAPVDLERELVGQAGFEDSPLFFASFPELADFNVFQADSNFFAPHGVDFKTLEVFGGERAVLTSFAPTVPTPAAILPSLLGLGGAAFRKVKHEEQTPKSKV